MIQSKQEAEDVLERVADKHGELSIGILDDEGVPHSAVYNYFDGIEDAERSVMDDVEYSCDECGRTFDERNSYLSHTTNADHERLEKRAMAEEMVDVDSNYVVYAILIERPDGQVFVYVGLSKDIVSRLVGHLLPDSVISLPAPEEERLKLQEYEFVDLIEIVECTTKEEAREMERRTMLKHCLRRGDMMVAGGK